VRGDFERRIGKGRDGKIRVGKIVSDNYKTKMRLFY